MDNNKELDKTSSSKQNENKKEARLILYNDDIHTFDDVIEALVEVCSHDPFRAEQCAMLTHFKGKAEIMIGSKEKLSLNLKKLREKELIVTLVEQ